MPGRNSATQLENIKLGVEMRCGYIGITAEMSSVNRPFWISITIFETILTETEDATWSIGNFKCKRKDTVHY